MTSIEYLQTKIQYLKDFRYLHEDVNDTVCEALDLAIEYLEKKIEEMEEPEYQEKARARLDTLEDLDNSQR